jgi:hypothetical protein
VRRALRDMFYAQQKELAGGPSDPVKLDDSQPGEWAPLRDWQGDLPTLSKLRHAARIRNAALLRLEQYIGGLDAAESLAHDDKALIDDLDSLWRDVYNAVARLSESMEQEFFLDMPPTDSGGPTINISSGSESGSVQDIINAGQVAQDKMQKLVRRLEELLLAKTPPSGSLAPSHWLPRWELAQAVPLAAWDAEWQAFTIDGRIPPLGVPPPAAAEQKAAPANKQPTPQAAATTRKVVLPSSGDVNGVKGQLQKRRKRWLERQALLANLLPQGSTAPTISVPGVTERELNAAALQIRERHRNAVTALISGSEADARSQWSADRVWRLAMGTDADQPQRLPSPMPLNYVRRKVQDFARIEGRVEPMDLQLGEEVPAVFVLHRGRDRPLDVSLTEARLTIPNTLAVTHGGKPVVSGDYPLADLLDEQGETIDLRVSPLRELRILSDGKLEDPLQSLTIVLTPGTLMGNRLTSIAQFRLPGARFLDVMVAGYEGTIDRQSEHSDRGGTGADHLLHLNPPPEVAAQTVDRSRARLHLRPLPRGETSYRIALVNRSTVPREVVASWYVLGDPRPASGWPDVERQIGEAAQTLRPRLMQPADSWLVPVYEDDQPPPPPAAAPAAVPAAAPAAQPSKPPLVIGTGLVCELTDPKDSDWKQLIWITAEPRHPKTYVTAVPRLTDGATGAEIVVRDHQESSALLPGGRMTYIKGNAGGSVEAKEVKFTRDVQGILARGELQIVARFSPPKDDEDLADIPFSLDVDGYPRALRFFAGTSTVQPVPNRGAVELRMLAVADPPMPDKEDTLLPSDQLFFNKPPKLRCQIEADFPTLPGNYAVRLYGDDSPAPLDFYTDRDFRVECRRQPAEESAKTNLSLVCQVKELTEPLERLTSASSLKAPRRIKLRAQIEEYDARARFTPLNPPVAHELEIVLDDKPPTLIANVPESIDWYRKNGQPVISFAVTDEDEAGGGSGLAEVEWGVARKGEDALLEGRKLSVTGPLSIRVPTELMMDGKPLPILIVARDRAGNRFGPALLQTINVKAVPAKAQAPKGSDSKK